MKISTGTITGLTTYPTGGITVTASDLTAVDFAHVTLKVRGPIKHWHPEYSRSGNSFTFKIIEHFYDKSPANTGSVTGLPSGVTAATSSGQTYDTVTHNHSMAHDHASTTSGTPNNGAAGVVTGVAQPNISTHTHPFDPANFTGNTGDESAHTHTWNNIYQHAHSITNTSTNPTFTEMANGTDISAVEFYYLTQEN